MNYEEIKAEIQNKRVAIQELQIDLDNYNSNFLKSKNEESMLRSTRDQRIKAARDKKYQEEKEVLISPLNERIAKLSAKRNEIESTFQKKKEMLNLDVYRDKFKGQLDINENLQEVVNKIHEAIRNSLDEEFYSDLNEMLEDCVIDIDIKNLPDIVERLNNIDTNSLLNRADFDLCNTIDNVFNTIRPNERGGFGNVKDNPNDDLEEKEDKPKKPKKKEKTKEEKEDFNDGNNLAGNVLVYAFLCIVLTFVMFKFGLPIYVLVLVAITIYNLYKNFSIQKLFIETRGLTNNIDYINKCIDDSLESDIAKDMKSLKAKYDKNMDIISNRQAKLEFQCKDIVDKLDKEFTFDSTDVENEFQAALDNIIEKQKSIKSSIETTQMKINVFKEELDDLNEKLNEVSANFASQFFNYNSVGKEIAFDGKFLIETSPEPSYFIYEKQSTCFLYSDDDTSYRDFLNIIIFNLVSRMDPSMISMKLYDSRDLGQDFVMYKGEDTYFTIFNRDSDIRESIDSLASTLMKRVTMFASKSIEEYNEFMLSLESLTESYLFQFFVNPNIRILEMDVSEQLFRNGARNGMYSIIFLNQKEFLMDKVSSIKLLDYIQSFKLIRDGVVKGVSKEFLRDKLTEK